MGSASAPLARVGVNNALEAAALAARLLGLRHSAAMPPHAEALRSAQAAARAAEDGACAAALALALGDIDAIEAAERRTQAYLPLIDAERRNMGAPKQHARASPNVRPRP